MWGKGRSSSLEQEASPRMYANCLLSPLCAISSLSLYPGGWGHSSGPSDLGQIGPYLSAQHRGPSLGGGWGTGLVVLLRSQSLKAPWLREYRVWGPSLRGQWGVPSEGQMSP